MKQLKLILHPILIFVFSILAVAMSLVLYIYWYVEVSEGLKAVIKKAKLDPDQALASQTWVVILVLSILVAIILVGIFTIFVYNQQTWRLYKLQRNFINNFTHELKTPVTSLKLYLETFNKYELKREDQLKYLDYMIHDADRLSNNINRLLSLAKIESKVFKGEYLVNDLFEVIQQCYERNKHVFDGCEINIKNPDEKHYNFRLDINLFEMMLMNLLTNAFKYNKSARPRVDIVFRTQGRDLNIRFEDNGIGLPKKEIKKIFRKFYQIDQDRDISPKGSGIGLYLVSSIARLHKIKILAETKGLGNGSVFSLIIPLKQLEANDGPKPQAGKKTHSGH